ncbi:MAG: TetR/AcrR family transcriptional regulator [Deltaproteobacteria bacterium]|nr:TetR/AcrR family transcriptional regulator [Deltaproteobacteria bacterium]
MGLVVEDSNKGRILNSLLQCIVEEGICNVTMRKIAEKADINLGSLHYYFKSKENIFIEFIQRLFETFIADIEKRCRPSDSPEKKLDAFFETGKRFVARQKDLFIVFVDLWGVSIRNSAMQRIFIEWYEKLSLEMEEIIQEGIEKGVFNNVSRHTLSVSFIAFVEGIGLHWHMRNGSFDLNEHFEIMTENLKKIILKK